MTGNMKMHFKFTHETQEKVVLHALRSILQNATKTEYKGKKYKHVIIEKKYKNMSNA
jgi:hypothetical protein